MYGGNNLMNLSQEEFDKVINAYNAGKSKFFIKGELQSFNRLRLLKVYQATALWGDKRFAVQALADQGFLETNTIGRTGFLNQKGMELFGDDITANVLTMDFGEQKEVKAQEEVQVAETTIDHKFDYAIITALYKDELKYVEPYINCEGEFTEDDKKLIRYGTLKANPNVKIVYASLLTTGMVEAAIVATDIITQYNPRVLFMPRVCGGKDVESLNLEDIIVATKVFTFQKGKLKDGKFHGEWEGVELNDKLIQKIQAEEENIIGDLHFEGKVHYEPMACSTAVIDQLESWKMWLK